MTENNNLTRRQLMRQFEAERREWLAAGMSEADIFHIHFGDDGDYRIWLNERKHIRADHKYAPGAPLALETMKFEGSLLTDQHAAETLLNSEQQTDIEAMLELLPPAQQRIINALVFGAMTAAEYAREHGFSKSVVSRTLVRARKNLKIIFSEGN